MEKIKCLLKAKILIGFTGRQGDGTGRIVDENGGGGSDVVV